MTTNATVTEQGVFTCDKCSKVLQGYDALFDICDTCASKLLIEPEAAYSYCNLYPRCGCKNASECTEN